MYTNIRKKIERHGILLLRLSVGIIFFWFGFLKFFADASAAESIASRTISWVTANQISAHYSMPFLAILECLIGLGLLTKKYMSFVIPVLYFQMAGTLLPLIIFPHETWKWAPFVPTLEGQYILKNCVLISAAIVLGVTAKGGKLIADPQVAQKAKKAEQQNDRQ